MPTVPLQYESLKSVIQYMEPNLRFQLSRQIPSIRVTEKIVPLKLDTLSFNDCEIKVNDMTYRFGVIREYQTGVYVPAEHKTDNERGGIKYDLDKYGLEIFDRPAPITPGDVIIRNVEEEWDLEQYKLVLEGKLKLYQSVMTKRLTGVDIDSDVITFWRSQHNNLPQDLSITPFEIKYRDDLLALSIDTLQSYIDDNIGLLAPYYCRRDNTRPPFAPVVQLNIESPRGKKVFRNNDKLNIQEAMKQINTFMFGGRREIVRSRRMDLQQHLQVLRLPQGFRIKIKHLKMEYCHWDFTYDGLKPIIDKFSLPLDILNMECQDDQHLQLPVVRSAAKLVIETYERRFAEFLPALLAMQNSVVKLSFYFNDFNAEHKIRLIENWLENDREVGTLLEYGVKKVDEVKNAISHIEQHFREAVHQDNCVQVPMRNGKMLEIKYALTDYHIVFYKRWETRCIVTLQVKCQENRII